MYQRSVIFPKITIINYESALVGLSIFILNFMSRINCLPTRQKNPGPALERHSFV